MDETRENSIKERRIALGITQKELARRVGTYASAIAQYEQRGQVGNMNQRTAEALAEVLQCDIRKVCALCDHCGKPKGRSRRFCSKKCAIDYYQIEKTCPVCGKRFKTNRYTILCGSKECSSKHKSQLYKAGVYAAGYEALVTNREKFFREHQGEQHVVAKHWIIESPTGEVYSFRNLNHFVRSNLGLFDGAPFVTVTDAIYRMKAYKKGTTTRGGTVWRGWQLIGFGD
jgi:transcriptional regulator with XRE-family HTH domain